MPQLKRYIQQLSPSGNVGAVRADPGLADTGADLLGKGAAAMGGAIAGLSSVFQQVQDIQDETDLSTADRQAGEYMAKVWSDIEQEPDYKQHETLYANALSKLTEFAPASPRANRMYQQRINAYSPSWKSKLMATSIRRMNWTIERDNQANIESSYRLMEQALERGDSETAEMAQFNIYAGVDILKKHGLISPDEAAKMKEDSDYAYDKSNLWYGAMEVMKLGQLDKAEEMIMASNLLEDDKSRAVNLLRYHNYGRQAKEKQEAALLEEQERTGIFEAIQDQRWDELPNLVRSSKYLSGTEKYEWEQRAKSRQIEFAKTGKDIFLQSDPRTFFNLWRAVKDGDPRVTDSYISSFVGRDQGMISYKEAMELIGERKRLSSETGTASLQEELVKSYMSQLVKMDTEFQEWAEDTEQKPEKGYGALTSGPELQGQATRAFLQFVNSHPNATDKELEDAFQVLLRSAKMRRIPQYMDVYQVRRKAAMDQTGFRMPMTLDTAPEPTTIDEFYQIVNEIEDEDESRKYYDQYKSRFGD